MSGNRSPWGTALLVYAVYRQTLSKLSGKRGNPQVRLLVRLLILLTALPFAGPILWHALWAMPTSLAVFLGVVIMHRIVRWFLRRYR